MREISQVTFQVQGKDLDELRQNAESTLAELAPGEWQSTLDISPMILSVHQGAPTRWKAKVAAVPVGRPSASQVVEPAVETNDLFVDTYLRVCLLIDRTTGSCKHFEGPFDRRIREIADHAGQATVMVDATGMGLPVAEGLMDAGVKVRKVKLAPYGVSR